MFNFRGSQKGELPLGPFTVTFSFGTYARMSRPKLKHSCTTGRASPVVSVSLQAMGSRMRDFCNCTLAVGTRIGRLHPHQVPSDQALSLH